MPERISGKQEIKPGQKLTFAGGATKQVKLSVKSLQTRFANPEARKFKGRKK